MANKLQVLAEHIRALPNQESLDRRRNQFAAIADQIGVSTEVVRTAKERLSALREFLAENQNLKAEFTSKFSTIRAKTEGLRGLIEGAHAPHSNALSPHLQTIRDAATSLEQAVHNQWAIARAAEIDQSRAFISLASQYDAESHRSLLSALR